MSTERDTYELQVDNAKAALASLQAEYQKLNSEVEETKKKHKSLADVMSEDIKNSFMTAQAQYDMLKEALRSTVEFVKEGIKEWELDAASKARQGVVLRNLGEASLKYRERLEEQQKQIEKNLGLDEHYIANLQNMVMGMGVSAEETERFTAASVQLAQLMGQDAVTAARLLARAHSEGKEELKKYGITVKDTDEDLRGFDKVLSEVEERTKGINESIPEYTRLMNNYAAGWGDFKKKVGEVSAELFVAINRGKLLAMKEEEEATKRYAELAKEAMMTHPIAGVDVTIGEVELKKDEEMTRKRAAAQKKADEERKQALIQALKDNEGVIDNAHAEELAKRNAFYKQMQKEAKDDADIEIATLDAYTEEEKEMREFQLQQKRKQVEEEKRLEREKAEHIKQIQQELASELKGYLQQTMSLIGSFVTEALLSNTKFNEKMKEYQLDREMLTQKELGTNKSRAEMEKQLAQEAKNAQAARIADFLAGVAQQAGMKAVMEAIEAIASAASYDYGGAALHGAAAAGFAALAVAAGGAAGMISSGRGMTTAERQQLESAELEKRNRNKREADQAGQVAEEGRGSTVNVYYLGLPGMTSAEMGRDLAKLQKEYDALKTGGA